MKRFIKEYATYRKKSIKNNELMAKDIKEEALNKIDKILKLKENGLVTTNETMSMIVNIFSR